jgi:hypothetical protein
MFSVFQEMNERATTNLQKNLTTPPVIKSVSIFFFWDYLTKFVFLLFPLETLHMPQGSLCKRMKQYYAPDLLLYKETISPLTFFSLAVS